MLLPSRAQRRPGHSLRAALRDAHETYRRYSGDEAGGDEPQAAEAPREARPARLPALAERGREAGRRLRERAPSPPARRDEPDVYLDVPKLEVDEIDLKIDELDARVALGARVLDLLRLDVGVDASLRGVDLKLTGVDAQALLKVRLENLAVIVDRVMSTIDRNPQILQGLTDHLGAALDEVGSGAARAVGDLGEGAGHAVEEVGGIARAFAPVPASPNGRPAR